MVNATQFQLTQHDMREEKVGEAAAMFWTLCKRMEQYDNTVSALCSFFSSFCSPVFTDVRVHQPEDWEEFKDMVRAQIELGFRTLEEETNAGELN